jgi:hypothetical protein
MQPSIEIVHQVQGRARLRVTNADEAAITRLEQRLSALDGVTEVRANALTGSLLLRFEDSWTASMLVLQARTILQNSEPWLPTLGSQTFCHWPRLAGFTPTFDQARPQTPTTTASTLAQTTLPLRDRAREVGARFWRRKLGLETQSGWMRLAGAGLGLLQIATRLWLGPVAADMLLWGLLLASIPLSATLLELTLHAIEPLRVPLELVAWFASRRRSTQPATAAVPAPALADVIPIRGGLNLATQAA